MKNTQCPVCYGEMERRRTRECYICGAWPETLNKPVSEQTQINRYALTDNQEINLCRSCFLEEFLVPNSFGKLLGLENSRNINSFLRWINEVKDLDQAWDKFCPQCNLRYNFLLILAQLPSTKEIE